MSEERRTEKMQLELQLRLEQLIELQNIASLHQQVIETNTIILSEIIKARQALKEFTKANKETLEGLISLGAGVYVNGLIHISGKVYLDVGAGVVIPLKIEEAINKLEEREKQIRESIDKARQSLIRIQNTINQLQSEINAIQAQLKK